MTARDVILRVNLLCTLITARLYVAENSKVQTGGGGNQSCFQDVRSMFHHRQFVIIVIVYYINWYHIKSQNTKAKYQICNRLRSRCRKKFLQGKKGLCRRLYDVLRFNYYGVGR